MKNWFSERNLQSSIRYRPAELELACQFIASRQLERAKCHDEECRLHFHLIDQRMLKHIRASAVAGRSCDNPLFSVSENQISNPFVNFLLAYCLIVIPRVTMLMSVP